MAGHFSRRSPYPELRSASRILASRSPRSDAGNHRESFQDHMTTLPSPLTASQLSKQTQVTLEENKSPGCISSPPPIFMTNIKSRATIISLRAAGDACLSEDCLHKENTSTTTTTPWKPDSDSVNQRSDLQVIIRLSRGTAETRWRQLEDKVRR